jgi:poly(ADP-ribose) glycohydrolase ARH3
MGWLESLFGARRNSPPPTVLGRALGTSPHEDRCIGCLLGCTGGDILGANLEFKSREEIQRVYGQVDCFLDSDGRPLGTFTDDTEMTLALASSLIDCATLNPAHCADSYARFFRTPPRRGYGPAVSKVLIMLCAGADYRVTGRAVYPEGSFANGGAMRIGPVGLAYRHAVDAVLREAVRLALLCTHVHPDAVDGAFTQAKAVGELVRCDARAGLDPGKLLAGLRAAAQGEAMRSRLETVQEAWAERWSDEELLAAVCTPNEYGEQFQIHAAEAVACALWALACCPADPEACIIHAVALGGDTDTVGAMAGTLAGALHGTRWFPRRWYDPMENEPGIGRDHLIEVARRLAALDLRTVAA